MRRALLLVIVLLAAAAPTGCGGGGSSGCDPSSETCHYEHDFGLRSIAPGEEVDGLCQSWTLGNEEELWVNTVHMSNDQGYHHSNWFFVPDNNFELPDGQWDCGANGFDELVAAILGGVLYAQSTQADDEVQQFAPGVAVRIPPRSRIIANTHILNVGDLPLESSMRVTFETIPVDQVQHKLAPFRLTYYDLHLPASTTSLFESTCDIKTTHEDTMQQPFELKLHYVLPHYHALGASFQVKLAGGARDGEVLHEIGAFDAEAHGKAFDPPIDVSGSGATGFTFNCGFDNPRDEEVGWGIGDQEMCVMLGFAETIMSFDASVEDGDGAIDETLADGTVVARGACSVLGIPFFQDK